MQFYGKSCKSSRKRLSKWMSLTAQLGEKVFMDKSLLQAYLCARDSNDLVRAKRILNDIVKSETPLVERCARKMARGDLEDLIQAGLIGVLRAVNGFDPKKGAWVSYAKQWILDEINTVIERRTVVQTYSRHWNKAKRKSTAREAEAILARTGHEATAEQLGVEDIDWVRQNARTTFIEPDTLTVDDAPPPMTRSMLKALATLTVLEQRILLKSIIEGKYPSEIAEEEGCFGTERTRQVIGIALAKLRLAMGAT